MNIKHKASTLLFLLFTTITSVNAVENPPSTDAPPTEKAYFRDTVIWPTTNIPVCWENAAYIGSHNEAVTRTALKNSWEATSLVRFTGWQKCPLAFSGIRITVIDTKNSPRAMLGIEGKAKIGKMFLNFTMNTPVTPSSDPTRTLSLRKRCAEKGVGIDQCIATTVVHEFGHVLGLSHEQNRPDDPLNVFCHKNDPETFIFTDDIGQFVYHLWGNTYFTPYDPNSVMNYCRFPYYGNTNLSDMDKVAVKVYYGNIPGLSTPGGWNGLVGKGLRIMRIPKLMINNLPYYATLTESSIDSNHDGKYDNLYSLTTAYNPTVQSTSPATLTGSVTKIGNVLLIKAGSKINIPLFKRSSTGKVVRVGSASLIKRSDGWWVFSAYKYFYY